MKLFIANCTRQQQGVYYRIPESPTPRHQMIDIGRQITVSGDLNTPQIDAIIGQLRKYGLVHVDEIDKTKAFAGLCYSVDKPIKVDQIMRGVAHNDEVLDERGQQIRKEAAVAVNNALEQTLQGKADVNKLDVSIEEVAGKDGKSNDFAENLRVTREEAPTSPARGGGGRRGGGRSTRGGRPSQQAVG
jgi:hypothetical protein